MQMDKGLDTGDMLFWTEVGIAPDETADTLHDKLAAAGAGLIVEALAKIEAGKEAGLSDPGVNFLAGRFHRLSGEKPENLAGGSGFGERAGGFQSFWGTGRDSFGGEAETAWG